MKIPFFEYSEKIASLYIIGASSSKSRTEITKTEGNLEIAKFYGVITSPRGLNSHR